MKIMRAFLLSMVIVISSCLGVYADNDTDTAANESGSTAVMAENDSGQNVGKTDEYTNMPNINEHKDFIMEQIDKILQSDEPIFGNDTK